MGTLMRFWMKAFHSSLASSPVLLLWYIISWLLLHADADRCESHLATRLSVSPQSSQSVLISFLDFERHIWRKKKKTRTFLSLQCFRLIKKQAAVLSYMHWDLQRGVAATAYERKSATHQNGADLWDDGFVSDSVTPGLTAELVWRAKVDLPQIQAVNDAQWACWP